MTESTMVTRRRPSLRGVSGIFIVVLHALLAGQVSAQIEARIVGGADVDEEEYPYFGAFKVVNDSRCFPKGETHSHLFYVLL
jgi:hypothetical protein